MFFLGATLLLLPQFCITLNQQPTSVVADANGNSYVVSVDPSDVSTGWLSKIDHQGNVVYRVVLSHGFVDGAIYATPDSQGNIYAAVGGLDHGFTPAAPNFFAVKIDPVGNIVYSLPLASSAGGYLAAPAVGPDGSAYFTGAANPAAWVPTTPGAWVSTSAAAANQTNAFVTKVSPAGDHIVYSTFLDNGPVGGSTATGSPIQTTGASIQVDSSGAAYVTGTTNDPAYPAISCGNCESGHTFFVSELSPDGTRLTYSTYLGQNEVEYNFSRLHTLIDSAGDLQVVTVANGNAVHARTLSPDGSSLLLDQTFSPAITESAAGGLMAVPDGEGNVIVSGTLNLPVTEGALQNGPAELAVLRLTDGAVLYSTRLVASPCQNYACIAPDGSGGIVVLGYAGTAEQAWSLARFVPESQPGAAIFGVGNLAESNTSAVLAPGELVGIFGVNLGPAAPVVAAYDANGRLPYSLGGTQVLIDGIAAPIVSVANQQVIAEAPFSLTPGGTANVAVLQNSATASGELPAGSTEPWILQGLPDASGTSYALAVNSDGTANSANNPAVGGSVASFFLNGAGVLTPAPADGTPGQPGQMLAAPISAFVQLGQMDGSTVQVVYAGAAPGLVGITQVNVRIPPPPYPTLFDGASTIYLKLGNASISAMFWVAGQ